MKVPCVLSLKVTLLIKKLFVHKTFLERSTMKRQNNILEFNYNKDKNKDNTNKVKIKENKEYRRQKKEKHELNWKKTFFWCLQC